MHEQVATFIPTQSFWRLLSAKHHVVLGARGQGKTALAKMLSHDHLALLARKRGEQRAWTAIRDQEFIGIYLPTRLEWVGGLKNKTWFNEREREELFQWRLNIASCIAFIQIAKSCISTYVTGRARQAQAENTLACQLSRDWAQETDLIFPDLLQLRRHLEDTDYNRQLQILRERTSGSHIATEKKIGLAFDLDLFGPLRRGITQLSRLLSLNQDCTWLLCLDEAEFLTESDHRIINSHMRAYPDKLFIKMTTMPYCHYTLATNIGPALVPSQDFAYINMDSDRVLTARSTGDSDTIGTQFGRALFKKLFDASDINILGCAEKETPSAMEVLGESELLDPRQEDWGVDSENMKQLAKYGSHETITRARRLVGSPLFASSIVRKINGPLLLRKQVDELKGNKGLSAYSGARMAIRCADDNPRQLINIFNALLMLRSNTDKWNMAHGQKIAWIPAEDQTKAMRILSASTLNRCRSFPDVGPALHAFLCKLGTYMQADLHGRPLTTDHVSSVWIDESISNENWNLVCVAIGHGLLHVNTGVGSPDEMPWREGKFHLAYALAPHFLLIPRRGKSVKLKSILDFDIKSIKQTSFSTVFEQLTLFNEGTEL
jgi:hypothetical protein